MTLREITEQRMAIEFFVALWKSLKKIKMLEEADNMSNVSRAFVYRYYRHLSCRRDPIFDDKQPGRR